VDWLYRKIHKLSPLSSEFLDATDLDKRIEVYRHIEDADGEKRKKGEHAGHTDTSDNAAKAYEYALEAEGEAEEPFGDEEFDRVMKAEWARLDAAQGDASLNPAHAALKRLLGDRYRPEDYVVEIELDDDEDDEDYDPSGSVAGAH